MNGVTVHYLPASAADANRLAALLAIPSHEITIHIFPDGEMRVIAWPASPTSILYAPLNQPNEKLLALVFAAESLRRNGSSRVVLVAPYLCYMRQDIAFQPGEAVSQKAVGRLIANYFDRVVTVDAHLHRTADLSDVCPGITADNLTAMPAIASHLRAGNLDPRTIIVGPDAESRSWDAKLLETSPEAPTDFDYVIVESTYGDVDRPTTTSQARRQSLAAVVRDARAADGALLIPAFAVERTQELIVDLVDLMQRGEIPTAPIFLDSPLAIRATDVFRQHANEFDRNINIAAVLQSPYLRFTESVNESKAIERLSGFHIIIAASGICDAGRIRHHLTLALE